MRAPARLCTTGASSSTIAPGMHAQQHAQRGENEHGGERKAVGLARAFGGGVRGRPRNVTP